MCFKTDSLNLKLSNLLTDTNILNKLEISDMFISHKLNILYIKRLTKIFKEVFVSKIIIIIIIWKGLLLQKNTSFRNN